MTMRMKMLFGFITCIFGKISDSPKMHLSRSRGTGRSFPRAPHLDTWVHVATGGFVDGSALLQHLVSY